MEEKYKKACAWLSTALEMEKKGKAFYDQSVEQCENAQCKHIFSMLAQDEVVHMDRIQKIYDSLQAGEPWCEEWKDMPPVHESLTRVFRDMAEKHGKDVSAVAADVQALEVGIDFEDKSIEFYKTHLDGAEEDLEKQFLEKMVSEEKDHHLALTDMKFYLQDPAAWFNEKEKAHWDGA